ncbi:MAG: YdaU family protein [Chitinophagaceae bacterium]
MSRHWMPLYIGDYLADTRRLSLAEHGAYMLLIMEYWRNGGLPDNDAKLSRILGVSASEWAELAPVLQEFFEPGWKHKRIDAELAKNGEISERRAAAANKRWSCKSNANADASAYAKGHANAMRSQPQPHISSTEDIAREPTALAILSECLSEQTAADLIAHRKKLRKPLTARAAKLLAKDFVAYGKPEEAAEMMIKNGWQGFHPTWVTNQAARAGPAASQRGWGSLYAELNGYGNGSDQKRIDETIPLLSGGSVDGAGNRDGDAGGVSGNLIELFASDHS